MIRRKRKSLKVLNKLLDLCANLIQSESLMTRQAILVKYMPCTTHRPARYKATCERGSITVSEYHDLNLNQRRRFVAEKLIEKFLVEDEKRGQPRGNNPWAGKLIEGGLPNGDSVFVFAE